MTNVICRNGLNVEMSRVLGRMVNAQPKRCFANSQLALSMIVSAQNSLKQRGIFACSGDTAYYCEGYADLILDMPGFWIAHGWVVRGNEIIDVTLNDEGARRATYHEVFRFTLSEVLAWLDKKQNCPMATSTTRENRIKFIKREHELFGMSICELEQR